MSVLGQRWTCIDEVKNHTRLESPKSIYIQSFKVGRVGDDELFGKLRVNVSPTFECSSQTGETPLRSSVTAGTAGWSAPTGRVSDDTRDVGRISNQSTSVQTVQT